MNLPNLKYDQFTRQVIADFKIVAFLMGLQGGLENFHATFATGIVETQLHTTIEEYVQNELNILLGKANIKWDPLTDPRKKLMPPLHIKLAPFKHFVKAVDKNSDAFRYPQNFCPKFLKKKDRSWYFCWPANKKDPGQQQIF